MKYFLRNLLTATGFAAAAAAFLLALSAGLLAGASPAAAHDELTGSRPADGAVVEAAPDAVELIFSGVPAAIGSEVRILDESGTDWADGQVRILDNTVTQRLRSGAPAGSYTVQWRVVSADAHPIEGSFGFTVSGGGAAGSAAPSAPSAEPSVAPSAAAPLADPSQSPVLNRSNDEGSPWTAIIPAAVVLLAVAVLIALIVRRRLRED
ncbi:copper resistance CopC family protein [Arthrobacter yangruifuii]|uniref:copper resistance CopC family protein n=1 Tax=Arthrobacter yangruifuii TaxID=2606616 RepID=UPI0011B60371|nr:copper resistance CopC family protein [Arthrobacter yangruifuii]